MHEFICRIDPYLIIRVLFELRCEQCFNPGSVVKTRCLKMSRRNE